MRCNRFIYSRDRSPCCRAQALLVRSRDGGFVSRNCLKCGRPHYVSVPQLPELRCDTCSAHLRIGKVDGTNYHYICDKCPRQWKLAEVLPLWSEMFAFSGLAAYGDDVHEFQ